MSWSVILEDEHGEIISQLDNEFASQTISSSEFSEKFKLLKYLDPFGDTIFNRLQMDDLIQDLRTLADLETCSGIDKIIGLAEVCLATPHTYLTFYGN